MKTFTILFFILCLKAEAYVDRKVGPVSFYSIPLSISETEFKDCLANLKSVPTHSPSLYVYCRRSHIEESKALPKTKINDHSMISVPSDFRETFNGCETTDFNTVAYNSQATKINDLEFQLSAICPVNTTVDQAVSALKQLVSSIGQKQISYVIPQNVAGAERAKIAIAQIPLSWSECESNLVQKTISLNNTQGFNCKIQTPPELKELERLEGFKEDVNLEVASLLKTSDGEPGYFQFYLRKDNMGRNFEIEVSYIDHDHLYPVLNDEIRNEFKRVIELAKSKEVRVLMKKSAPTTFKTSDAMVYERTITSSYEACESEFQAWPEWMGCIVNFPVKTSDIAFLKFGVRNTYKTYWTKWSLFNMRGFATTENQTSWSRGGGPYLNNSNSYRVFYDRKRGDTTKSDTAKDLLKRFFNDVPSMSLFIIK